MRKRICSLILLLVLLLLTALPAYAAGETVSEQIAVKIALEGPILEPYDTFTVELSAVTAGAPVPEGTTDGKYLLDIEGKATENTDTIDLSFPNMGVYSYKIRQIPGDQEACTYDSAEYDLTVYVLNENGSRYSTTVLYDQDGNKVDEALFTNEYEVPEPARLDPPVKKVVEVINGTPPTDEVFVFAMIPSSPDAPMPDNEECRKDEETGALYMEKTDPGEYEFGWMDFGFDTVGNTYKYTLKEIPGSNPNYTYDPMEYTMTVTVSMENRKIVLDVVYTNDSDEEVQEPVVFTNRYEEPETPKTGDNHLIYLWIALFAAGVIGIVTTLVLFLRSSRKKNNE
ncbi:MAG: hypothetical protein II781_00030 [Clostridia bacterium]|nr:hypothetical protein [Clostridia bacterium]